eukprot:TRINITY_DN82188_c0_g1_i1.p1 TRINITY_DN82188_c0_g1~~TRINITY_DN82188_c0_g1_i1.p1  ORF type:complete len:838 (-),score=269.96 TRINITY_DN82188_c0_g1_i1:173-2467(-)
MEALLRRGLERPDGLLAEHEVYEILGSLGIPSPEHVFVSSGSHVTGLPGEGPFVAKCVLRGRKDGTLVTHKTDLNAIEFNVSANDAQKVLDSLTQRFSSTRFALEGVLFVKQERLPSQLGAEMLLSGYSDPFFGPCVALGFGGTIVEYLKKVMLPSHATVFMPALYDMSSFDKVLAKLPAVELAEGRVRGMKKLLDHDSLVKSIDGLAAFMKHYSAYNPDAPFLVEEVEINPAMAIGGKLVALDGVLRVAPFNGPPKSVISPKPLHKIENMLRPKSVAIAGVSSSPGAKNPGNVIMRKVLAYGLPTSQVYPIHPKADEIEGCKCVRDIEGLLSVRGQEPVDLLLIGVPAAAAGAMVDEAFTKYAAHGIQVISGGFGETKSGARMQKELEARLAQLTATPERRPVVNGPNTVGNFCDGGVETVFTPSDRSSRVEGGMKNACLLAQSGAFMLTRVSDLAGIVRPSMSVSVGNQMDLSATDFLEHFLGALPDVTTFAMYIEGLNEGDGIRLMNIVQEARRRGKFVILYKAGRTEAGMEAAKGHTAAMAGDFEMFRSLLEHAGALVADSFDEFNDLLMATTRSGNVFKMVQSVPKDAKIGVAGLSNAGFEKCAIADHLLTADNPRAALVKWAPETFDRLTDLFKKHRIGAIVDVQDVLDVTPMMGDAGYDEVIRATLDDPGCIGGIYGVVPETDVLRSLGKEILEENSICNRLIRINKDYGDRKLVFAVIESGWKYEPLLNRLKENGVSAFPSADRAARVMNKIIKAL